MTMKKNLSVSLRGRQKRNVIIQKKCFIKSLDAFSLDQRGTREKALQKENAENGILFFVYFILQHFCIIVNKKSLKNKNLVLFILAQRAIAQ